MPKRSGKFSIFEVHGFRKHFLPLMITTQFKKLVLLAGAHVMGIVMMVLFMCSPYMAALGQKYEWAHTEGNSIQNAIALDNQGNVYSIGSYNYPSNSPCSSFLQKRSPNGNLLWEKCVTESGAYSTSEAIALDGAGNIYVGGTIVGPADFDPGPATQIINTQGARSYVLKLSASGNFLWVKTIDFTPSNTWDHNVSLFDLKVNSLGEVVLCGAFSGTMDFDPGAAVFTMTSNHEAGFVMKLNPSGGFLWANKYDTPKDEEVVALEIGPNNSIYFTTNSTGGGYYVFDFDPGPNVVNVGSTQPFVIVAKLNNSGAMQWASEFKTSLYYPGGPVFSSGMALDQTGNVLISGRFRGNADFDPTAAYDTLSSPGVHHSFVAKLNPSGGLKWATDLGGTICTDVGVDNAGFVYGAGKDDTGQLSIQNGGTTYTEGRDYYDVNFYIERLDSNGTPLNIKFLPYRFTEYIWTDQSHLNTLAVSPQGDCHIGGEFTQTLDFNLPLQPRVPTSTLDQFLAKYSFCPQVVVFDTITICEGVMSPSGLFEFAASGNYYDVVPGLSGCDTAFLITANVTVIRENISWAANDYAEIDYPQPLGATFQWLNCDSNMIPIPGATSDTINLNLIDRYIAVEISYNGCIDTSACLFVYIVNVDDDQDAQVSFYPNPGKGHAYIDFGGAKDKVDVAVMNSFGQVVHQVSTQSSQGLELDLQLPTGMYYVQINGEGLRTTIKWIISR